MQLRDYQEKLCTTLAQKLASGKRKIIAQLATGGGKTICFSAIASRFTTKSKKSVLILVHRKELLQQTRRTLYKAYQIDCQIIIAGMKHVPPAPVYVGMVESVSRRVDRLKDIGLVIIDEAHIANFNKLHEHFNNAFFIGFTATPLSASKEKPLNQFYNDIVCGIDIPELISMGNLCPNQTFAARDTVDRSLLKTKGGEFDTGLMGIEFSKQQHVNNTVKIYKEKAEGTKAIVFNSTVDHSLKVCDAFIASGYNAIHFDGTTESKEREQVLQWFEQTTGAILCNVGIATTGFDEPTIETVIVNRSTMSMPLWLQMTGRGSRPTEAKKMFTIIDMGGNAVTHGDWCDSRNWEEIFKNPPKKTKEGVAPSKNCPDCDSILNASATVCKFCGFQFPPPKQKIEEDLGEFILVTKNLDVLKMIEYAKQQGHKEYASLWQICSSVAMELKYSNRKMTEEKFMFALQLIYEKAKVWCDNAPTEKRKRLDKWHKDILKEKFIEQLKKHYPSWQPQQQA